MKSFLLFISIFSLLLNGFSQNADQLNCRFEALFLSGDMMAWERLTDSLATSENDFHTEKTYLFARYGLIGNLMGTDQKSKAKPMVYALEDRLERNLKKHPTNATLHALYAATTGFKINLQPWKVPVYGSESLERIENARKYRKEEPLPLVENANGLYFRPEFVGGDKAKAIQLYEQAFKIYQQKEACDWMYYSIGAWLGQVYAERGNKQKAVAIYKKLLSGAPNFKWVRDELLPGVE